MNIGLYSFKMFEAQMVEIANIKIKYKLLKVSNVYLYSENTTKQRINKRDGFYKMLQDYLQGKIDIIVFENMQSLGSDIYIRGELLKLLLKLHIDFFLIEEDILSTSCIGTEVLNIIIYMIAKSKKENDKRSKMGNIIRDREKRIISIKIKMKKD